MLHRNSAFLVWASLAAVLALCGRPGFGEPVGPGVDYEPCSPGAPAFLPVPQPPDAETARWLAPIPTARYRLDEARPAGRDQWRVLAVGDIMTSREVLWTASAQRVQGAVASDAYGWVFRSIEHSVMLPDLAFGNLEFPVRPDLPAAGCKPFNGEPAYLDALKKLGFDALFTANNHMLDQGVRGTETTLEQLRRRDIENFLASVPSASLGTRSFILRSGRNQSSTWRS